MKIHIYLELQIWKNGPTFDENYKALSLKYLDVSKNLGMSFVDLDYIDMENELLFIKIIWLVKLLAQKYDKINWPLFQTNALCVKMLFKLISSLTVIEYVQNIKKLIGGKNIKKIDCKKKNQLST